MSTRVICPDCGDRLKLHKPAIDSTRVKCRNCGAKFYAGKSENWTEEQELAGGFHPLPTPAVSTTRQSSVAVADPIAEVNLPRVEFGPAEHKHRQRIRIEETKPAKWAMPLGIAAVIGIAAAGIFLGQSPSTPEMPSANRENKLTTQKSQPNLTPYYSNSSIRPQELVGVWETNDVANGLMDFAADGTVRIRGAFLDDAPLDIVSQWFLVKMVGDDYILEIGPEPTLKSNHGMRLVKQTDGTLLMTKYVTVAALSVKERRFKKIQ